MTKDERARAAHLLDLLRAANERIAVLERGGPAGKAELDRARAAILEGAEAHGLGLVEKEEAFGSEPE